MIYVVVFGESSKLYKNTIAAYTQLIINILFVSFHSNSIIDKESENLIIFYSSLI